VSNLECRLGACCVLTFYYRAPSLHWPPSLLRKADVDTQLDLPSIAALPSSAAQRAQPIMPGF